MNKTLEEGKALTSEVVNMANDEVPNDVHLVLCTPAIHLYGCQYGERFCSVSVSAQNMSEHVSGAYTGDISADMIFLLVQLWLFWDIAKEENTTMKQTLNWLIE